VAEVLVCCATAIVVAIIMAGGINRAAFYISKSIVDYMQSKKEARKCIDVETKKDDTKPS
jgi:hypothetical protein